MVVFALNILAALGYLRLTKIADTTDPGPTACQPALKGEVCVPEV